jgi:DNA-binding NtrC family response regulator
MSPRRLSSDVTSNPLPAPPVEVPADLGFRNALEAYKKQLIVQTLERTHWHRTKTAELLRLPRKTLFRKMKQYGLELKQWEKC